MQVVERNFTLLSNYIEKQYPKGANAEKAEYTMSTSTETITIIMFLF